MIWMLENVAAVKDAAARGTLAFGTMDSWLMWRLSDGAVHATDVTNASRTMLMNLATLQWDTQLTHLFGISLGFLPTILSCSAEFCTIQCSAVTSLGAAVRITGCIGDQQGALVGHMCFAPGLAKNTYGTGCFLLANIGQVIKLSSNGLLTTVGFQLGRGEPCIYALEGSIAGAGATIQWMRDKLSFFSHVSESEPLARQVPDSGGVAFVPAFSGLLAPYWNPTARGTIVGMSFQTTKAHIVRAALEAVAQQVAAVVSAMSLDSGIDFKALKVDGGMAANKVLMQMQADALGVPVDVAGNPETTALGAAICAGLFAGVWGSTDEVVELIGSSFRRVDPVATATERAEAAQRWNRAVERATGWAKL
jgi:glycerol kinase